MEILGGLLIIVIIVVGAIAGIGQGVANLPKTCPFCKENIKKDATVCKHCGKEQR
jgi:predicted amidophosphoribosyltransferase